MASNFKIRAERKNDALHLRLRGDFDGGSAFALIHLIGRSGAGTIFIHTNELKEIHPFGREVFLKNLAGCGKERLQLVFTGRKGSQIAPSDAVLLPEPCAPGKEEACLPRQASLEQGRR
jgi:hypothetical protein